MTTTVKVDERNYGYAVVQYEANGTHSVVATYTVRFRATQHAERLRHELSMPSVALPH